MKPLVIIGCGAKKQDKPCPASDLYTGPLFVKALAYARAVAKDDDIRILSAKHGLLKLDQIVRPYEHRLTKADIRGLPSLDITVRGQLEDLECGHCPVLMLASNDYSLLFHAAWWSVFQSNPKMDQPLAGLGIGYQMQWLKECTP
jgi:hypothetical protein